VHGTRDGHGHHLTKRHLAFHNDQTIHFGSVAIAAPNTQPVTMAFDQHVQSFAQEGLIFLKRNLLLLSL